MATITVGSVSRSWPGKCTPWGCWGASPWVRCPALRGCPWPVPSHSEEGAGLEAGELGQAQVKLLCLDSLPRPRWTGTQMVWVQAIMLPRNCGVLGNSCPFLSPLFSHKFRGHCNELGLMIQLSDFFLVQKSIAEVKLGKRLKWVKMSKFKFDNNSYFTLLLGPFP